MDSLDILKKEIAKTEIIMAESRENLAVNPDDYSARLLLMSIENYLADLHRKLDLATVNEKAERERK